MKKSYGFGFYGGIGFGLLSIFLILKFSSDGDAEFSQKLSMMSKDYNPCCDFPCENRGICQSLSNNTYYCDCTGTDHIGLNCDIPTWYASLVKFLKPAPETLHSLLTNYSPIWSLVNMCRPVQRMLMKYIYLSRGDIVDSPVLFEGEHPYTTLDAYYNESYYGRTLPPVPVGCPTPMGTKGPKVLLDVKELFDRIFKRRQFKPEPHGSNLLFQYYAQHFTHQFFRTDYASKGVLTKGNGGVDASNIYGLTEEIRRGLRSNVDGKLKTRIVGDEEFPPLVKDVTGVNMEYPPSLPIPEDSKYALGHPFFALLPGLFMYATIWVREHNRVCDVLKEEHPHWDDERLYQTAKLIIVGEIIKITIEDYVKHLSQYKIKLSFDPELTHGTRFQFDNRIMAEFDQLYHWHPLVPDNIDVNGTQYAIMEMAFSNAVIFKHGLDNFIHAMATNRAGHMTTQNHAHVIEPIFSKAITNTRQMRFQSFNQYRKRFGMKPYKSFKELTGEDVISKELEDIYQDIDALEYYVGLIAEESGSSVTGISMVNMGGPWSIKGLLANPICSPKWWKPSTFGGEVGFNIIKTASLKNLFCKNMKSKCKHIAYTVPSF